MHSSRRPRNGRDNPRRKRTGGPHPRPSAVRRNGGEKSCLPGSRLWTSDRVSLALACGLLLLAVALVFGQTAGFGFVNYDDSVGIYENRLVTGDLTLRSVWAVFAEHHLESWCPLTCVSHMLVWHLFGHGAAIHHVINVLLHAASALLLLLVLRRMTGRLWPSALAAAVFAAHPLRAESVAWVTERKDVLSGLLFMLTLTAYLGYVGRRFSLGRYLSVLGCFIVALAAKPMAVTLPFLLLLLDYWPLGRMKDTKPRSSSAPSVAAPYSVATEARSTSAALWKLVLEKVPMLAIAGLFCLVAVRGQAAALDVNQLYSPAWRIGNAAICYAVYLGRFFWPLGLAPVYPRRPVQLPSWQVVLALLTLASITAAAWWQRRRPFLLVGWLWYLGMLLPVIGLVQFGVQAEADRFTYLPGIGLSIALVWGAADVYRAWPRFRRVSIAVVTCLLATMLVSAWCQTGFWRDSETLWKHTLACTSRNAVAHNDLGIVLAAAGRLDEAMSNYRKAIEVREDYAEAHRNLGAGLIDRGRLKEAISHLRRALSIQPYDALAHNDLAIALAAGGCRDEALSHYRRALEIRPDYTEAHVNLGFTLAACGRLDEAVSHYRQALEIQPNLADARYGMGKALAARGRWDEAIAYYREALEIRPDFAEAHHQLGKALAARGRTDEAIAQYRSALVLAAHQNKTGLANELKARIRRYEAGSRPAERSE